MRQSPTEKWKETPCRLCRTWNSTATQSRFHTRERSPGTKSRSPEKWKDAGIRRTSPRRRSRQDVSRAGAVEENGMSVKRKSRRAFVVESVAGLNAAWLASNYPGILAAQQYAQQGGKRP